MESVFMVARDFELFGSYVKFSHMTSQCIDAHARARAGQFSCKNLLMHVSSMLLRCVICLWRLFTEYRHEIIIEGSTDGIEWKEYEFKYKPSRVTKMPPFVPFHLPAMDWRLWFLPLEASRGGEPPVWFMRILARLLECEPTVMALFDHCPFGEANRPQYMRALLYDYRFRFMYEKEEELKKIVKEYGIKDTTVVEQSEDEAEEEEEEEEEEVEQEDAGEMEGFDGLMDTHKQGGEEKPTGEGQPSQGQDLHAHGEGLEDASTSNEQKEQQQRPSSDAKEATHTRSASSSGGKKPRGVTEGQTLRSRGSAAGGGGRRARSSDEERSRKALLARQRKMLQALLRGRLGGGGWVQKPMKTLAGRVAPPAFDEQGRRVWWVRRHLIGHYGPTLAVKPQRQPAEADAPAWEQAMEDDEEY